MIKKTFCLKLLSWGRNSHFECDLEIKITYFFRCIKPHPNIIEFWGYFEGGRSGFAMKKYDGTLHDVIHDKSLPLTRSDMFLMARDIARGLEHLHNRSGIVHFDLKPANILFSIGHENEPATCCVSDFGYARPIGSDINFHNDRLVKGLWLPKKRGFTRLYCSPEVKVIISSIVYDSL